MDGLLARLAAIYALVTILWSRLVVFVVLLWRCSQVVVTYCYQLSPVTSHVSEKNGPLFTDVSVKWPSVFSGVPCWSRIKVVDSFIFLFYLQRILALKGSLHSPFLAGHAGFFAFLPSSSIQFSDLLRCGVSGANRTFVSNFRTGIPCPGPCEDAFFLFRSHRTCLSNWLRRSGESLIPTGSQHLTSSTSTSSSSLRVCMCRFLLIRATLFLISLSNAAVTDVWPRWMCVWNPCPSQTSQMRCTSCSRRSIPSIWKLAKLRRTQELLFHNLAALTKEWIEVNPDLVELLHPSTPQSWTTPKSEEYWWSFGLGPLPALPAHHVQFWFVSGFWHTGRQ